VRRPPKPCEFERLDYYARFIRTLRRTDRRYRGKEELAFIRILEYLPRLRPGHCLIPRLDALIWTHGYAIEVPGLIPFVRPGLRKIVVSINRARTDHDDRDSELVEQILWLLTKHEGSLQRLWIQPRGVEPHYLASLTFQETCADLIAAHPGLVSVSTMASRALMVPLGALVGLRHLDMWFAPDVEQANAKTPARLDMCFPSLETLHIEGARSLLEVTSVLTKQGCFARRSISVFCSWEWSVTQSRSFLEEAVDADICAQMESFVLVSETGIRLPGIYGSIGLADLRPLTTFKCMEQFEYSNGSPIRLTDADIHHLVVAWPRISILDLGVEFGSRQAYEDFLGWGGVSMEALGSFTRCKHLTDLSLMLNSKAHGGMLEWTRAACPVVWLDVGISELSMSDAEATADFLAHQFPHLRRIVTSKGKLFVVDASGWIKAWRQVQSDIEKKRRVREC